MIDTKTIQMEARTLKNLASELSRDTSDLTEDRIFGLITEIKDCVDAIEDAIEDANETSV